jgi:hypothetical protein
MKKIYLFSLAFILSLSSMAQTKSSDAGRIVLNTVVPEQIEGLTGTAKANLENKLSQIATKNGMGGSALNPRFVLAANVIVQTKDITPTAPPMHAYTIEVTLFIGDGIEGTKFASTSVTLKGVGETETKAYMMALKNLKVEDPKYQAFIENGKKKIVDYYISKCDFIIKEAQQLASRSEYDAAIAKLVAVPEVCKECYDKAMDAVAPIFKQQIDRTCKLNLASATSIWNAGQNADAASESGKLLSAIDPNSSCFVDAKSLSDKIAKRVLELDNREWNFQMKQYDNEVSLEKATIQAARDIGVAYGENQPQTITYDYDVWGWW